MFFFQLPPTFYLLNQETPIGPHLKRISNIFWEKLKKNPGVAVLVRKSGWGQTFTRCSEPYCMVYPNGLVNKTCSELIKSTLTLGVANCQSMGNGDDKS